jgi:hypothetical protein
MRLDSVLLEKMTEATPKEVWLAIIDTALKIASEPLAPQNAVNQVAGRDNRIGALDDFLATSGWDLWQEFGTAVERTSDRLIGWWKEPFSSKAVLILDGLSLRELPWLLQGAKARGYTLLDVRVTASELPGETNEFAHALGFSGRSQLQNNGAPLTHKLMPCKTETTDLPWKDCGAMIGSFANWVFWHEWPDKKLHDASGAGPGLAALTADVVAQLTSDDFWNFVQVLATGRRLVITSDHGYAASGSFPDADTIAADFLKSNFASGRGKSGTEPAGEFLPPVAMQIGGPHGDHLLALGRKKWKSKGGYPTLTHGGLTVLEVLSPYIELTR